MRMAAKGSAKKKKDLKSWFMKNIILPNNEIIDKPGYIVSKYSGKGTRCYVRELLFPEKIIAQIENDANSSLGEEGLSQVYAAGKMWGVRYGRTTGLPKKSEMPEKDFRAFLESFMKFMEAEYASSASFELDHKKNRFTTIYKDLMICRLNGLGHFLMGTMNGAWEHMAGVKTEAIHLTCQGRGGAECVIECAPASCFGKKEKIFKCSIPAKLGLEKEYFTLNTVKKAQYAKNSLLDLLTGRIISYEGGFFECKGDRFLLNEASSIYFLEKNLGKTKKGEEILFNAAFDYFFNLGKKNKSLKMAQDFLPALGWGDINVEASGRRAFCRSYPWTGLWKETTFPILRGMLSGILSANSKDRVVFKTAKPTISSGSLDIVLSGD
jgi:predicted hydrocarbon binding protein